MAGLGGSKSPSAPGGGMVTSYVVVAIPSENDYVRKISSEKVPHLTLLYLDAHLDDVGRVEEYIRHVVDTSLNKFWLDVDRRGELGDQNADVLFFGKYGIKRLEEFRRFLLQDPDILRAYNSVEQYPQWTPHLTLGYPETPAKEDKREYPGIRMVDFDRIALWTGDYEGVEFPLKEVGGPESFEMSIAKGEDFLEHFGVKGMHWGVRKVQSIRQHPLVKAISPSEDHNKAEAIRLKAKFVGPRTLSNRELQHVIKRLDLEVKFKDLKTVKHKQSLLGKGASWVGRAANDILVGTAISWLKRPSLNPFPKREARPHSGRVGYQSWAGRPDAISSHRPVKVIEGRVVPRAIGPGHTPRAIGS